MPPFFVGGYNNSRKQLAKVIVGLYSPRSASATACNPSFTRLLIIFVIHKMF